MATNGGSINYTVKYNVDKTGLNQMKASLQEIFNLSKQDLIKINSKATDADLAKLKASAKEVESALERAFNPNLGTLNVSKFNQELKKLDVKRIYQDFNIMGQAGRNAFRNITSDVLTTNMQLKQTHTLLDNMATTMANTIKWGVASSVMNTFTGSVQQAYGYVKNLDSSLNDIRIVTNKSADEMAKFAVQANKAAKELGASTTSYTDASLIYYQQGLTDAEVAARAEVTLKAANVTGQSADAVSEQLTAVWNGYKVSAEEAELYIDKLAAVAATTASDLEELSVGMSKVASAASVMGVDVDQLNAQLATIVSVTRQAPESVGTALKTIYARMGDIEAGLDGETSLSNYTEQMAQMGYDVLDANGKLRDMGEVIEEIGNNWKNMSREQQISLSQTVAGTRQYNNLLALFDNWDMYTKAIETSGNAAGTLQEQQDIYMDRTVAHLQQLRTATEDLYDSLFETKSFNNLLDGITGAVDLLGNFADAIGGGGNALLLLGTIGAQVFSKQIASGLAVTIQNLITAQENTKKLRAEQEILNQYQNANINDSRTQELINMKQKILDLDKAISNEERNIANEYIKQQNELYKQQDNLERKLQIAQEIYERTTGESANISTQAGRNAAADELDARRKNEFDSLLSNDTLDNINNVNKQYKAASQELSTIKKQSVIDTDAQKAAEKRLENAKIDLMKATESQVDQAEELISNLTLSRENQDKLTEAVKEYKNLTKDGFDADNVLHISAAAKVQEVFKTVVKDTSKELEAQSVVLRNHEAKVNANKQAVENATLTFNQFIQQIDLRNTLQQFTTFVSSIGQVVSGINSLVQITKIWNNEDLSAGEKFLQIMTSLTMGVPMALRGLAMMADSYNVLKIKIIELLPFLSAEQRAQSKRLLIQQLYNKIAKEWFDAGKKYNAAEIKRLATLEAENILKEQSIGTTLKKIATDKLEHSVILKLIKSKLALLGINVSLLGTLGLVVAAVGLVAGAVFLAVKAHEAEEKALNKSIEKQKELTDAYKETKQAYDDLKSSLDKYEDSKKSLDGMVQGTREWRDAVQEVNDQVLDLIQTYPELANAVDSTGPYLTLKEDEYEKVLAKKAQQTQAQYRATLLGAEDVNEKQLAVDTEKYKRIANKELKQIYTTNNPAPTSLGNAEEAYDYGKTLSVNEEQLTQVAKLVLDNQMLLADENKFITAVTENGIASADVAEALFKSQDVWKKLTTEIVNNTASNKALSQNRYSSYLSTNTDLQENSTYKEYQGLVTSILATQEENDSTLKSSAETLIKGYDVQTQKQKYQELTGISDEQLKDTNINDIVEFLIQEEVTRLIAENADEILADIEQLTASKNGSNIATFLQSGANAFSPEQIAELQGLNAQDLHDLYVGNEDIFTEYGYESVFAFINAFKDGLEDYDPQVYWDNQITQLKSKLETVNQSMSTLLDGGELSDEDLAALENQFPDLAKIWDKSSQEYLETLEKIREEHEKALSESLQGRAEESWKDATVALDDYQKSLDKFNSSTGDKKDAAEIELVANTEALNTQLEEFFQNQYELEISITDDLLTDVDNIITATEHLQTAVGSIGDGFKIAAEDSEALFEVFPELAHNAEVLADGTIQLDQAVVSEVLKNNGIEIDSDKEVVRESIKNRIAELEAKKETALAQLETVRNTAAKDLDIQEILGDSHAEFEKYKTGISEQAAKDEVANNAASTKAIIDNWAAKEQAAIDYATTAIEAASVGEGDRPPEARVKSDKYSIVNTVTTQNNADQVEKTKDEAQELLKQDLENFLQNSIDSYEKQIAQLTSALGNLNYETTKGVKDAIEERDKEKASKNKKDEMDLLKDQVDIYHDINMEIKSLSKEMDKLGKQEKKLFGQQLIDNLNEQLGVLQAQTNAYKEKIKLAQKEASMYRGNLASQGINFDAQGNVTNYVAAMKGKQDYLNGLISKYNSMSETEQKNFKSTVEQAKKDYEQFKKDMEYYENLVSETIPDLEAQIQDAMDKQIEIQIQKFTMEVEIRLEMAEAERDWNEFKKKIIDDIDDDDILGNAMAKMLDFDSYYKDSGKGVVQALTKQVNDTLDQLHQIDETGTSSVYGDNKAQAMEDLQKYYTELMQQLEDVKDLQDEIKDAYLDMIDEANEKFDAQIEKYETITELIEHNMNVVELLNGDDAYDQLAKYYELQERNNLKQLDFHRQEVAFWRERMDSVEEGSEEWDAYRENWQEAVNELNESVSASIENLIAKYQNTVSGIFEDLNDKVTGGKGLDYVKEEWDLINKNADQYLDTINSAFAIRELEGKYLDALDNTDSISAQRQLNDMMNEQLNMLRAKDKLTQYDVDRANALYEIELKKIALQEAQQNKSQMRLRRDAQGNYSYQYVADQDAIGNAEDELASAQNSLYNMDKEQYRANLDEIYEMYVEFQDKLNELYMDNTLSDVEREEQKKLLVEQYGELINGLVEQNEDIRLNLQESALQAYADFQGELLMEDIVPQWDSSVQEMADKFAGEGGFIPTCQDSLIELDEATADYEDSLEDLEDTAGITFDEIEDGLDKNIDLTYDFIDANDELIDKYGEQLNAIEDVWNEVQILAQKYEEAERAAIRATEAAYKYWQTAKAMAADGIDGGPSYSGGLSTSGYSGGGDYPSGGGSTPDKTENTPSNKIPNTSSGSKYYIVNGSGSSWSGIGSDGAHGNRSSSSDLLKKFAKKVGYTKWTLNGSGLASLKTGGYTGSWTNGDRDGKLALLHQKELVLNSEDTKNILSAVDIVRSIGASMRDRINSLTSKFNNNNNIANNGMVIEQKVSIDARFEGQTESSQIETALINLVNYASQHAYDTTR